MAKKAALSLWNCLSRTLPEATGRAKWERIESLKVLTGQTDRREQIISAIKGPSKCIPVGAVVVARRLDPGAQSYTVEFHPRVLIHGESKKELLGWQNWMDKAAGEWSVIIQEAPSLLGAPQENGAAMTFRKKLLRALAQDCSKAPYSSREFAQVVAEQCAARECRPMFVYQCPRCGLFHLTKVPRNTNPCPATRATIAYSSRSWPAGRRAADLVQRQKKCA